MANNNWNNYTEKNVALTDKDEIMLRDSTDGKNKKSPLGKIWNYMVDKMATAVVSKLETDNKTIIGAINYLYGNSFRFSNLSSTPHTITVRRTSKNKQILHCALLYITNDCAAMINMDMVSGNVSGTKVYPICGTNTPTASVSNDELKISINAWRNVLLLMPENEFSATLSE